MIRRKCPWCAKAPVCIECVDVCEFRCMNDECLVMPVSKPFRTKDEALFAWNNPLHAKDRFFSETELKDIFDELFLEDYIKDYFFKKK